MLAALLAVATVYLSYSFNSGITITNDGSHFALFDSLVTTGSPELKQVRRFAFGDSALYQGRYYSDRNPGLALATYGLYQVGGSIDGWLQPLFLDPLLERNYNAGQRQRIPFVMLVPALSAGAVVFLSYLLCLTLGSSPRASLVAALAVSTGTILLRYGSLFYSHALAAALIVAACLCLFRGRSEGSGNWLAGGIFLLALAVLVEHLMILLFLPLAAYLWHGRGLWLWRWQTLLACFLAGLMPALVLMLYNWVCFDSPWSIAHFHHSSDQQNHQLGTLLRLQNALPVSLNLLFGAPREVVGRQDLHGLFSGSPFLYFLLLLPVLCFRQRQSLLPEHLFLLSAIVVVMLGAASVFAPYGGWDRDYRYFAAILPLFAPLLSPVLDFLLRLSLLWQAPLIGAFGALWVWSLQAQLGHLRHPGQSQYDRLLVNADAALVNVSMALALLVVPALLVLAIAHGRRTVAATR